MTAAAIRESVPADAAALRALYAAAFPDEALWPLVAALLDRPGDILTLVAAEGPAAVGHAVFTSCGLEGGAVRLALLGPLAVAPSHQRRGIGHALVSEGLTQLTASGVDAVLVLGDPRYYRRFGFVTETALRPPYPLPDAWRKAWQSLTTGSTSPPAGRLCVPPPWRDAALWVP